MKKQIGAFSIFALFAGVSTSALAQEQTPAPAPAGNEADTFGGDIIVTAQKRSERLQTCRFQ